MFFCFAHIILPYFVFFDGQRGTKIRGTVSKNTDEGLPMTMFSWVSRRSFFAVLLIAGLFFSAEALWGQNSSRSGSSSSGGRSGNSSSGSNSDEPAMEYYRYGYRSAVGGFSIDAENAFRMADKQEIASMVDQVKSLLAEIPADLDRSSATRKISLKRLAALLEKCAADKTPVPDAALYLGGLTGIEYVAAVPEENDIYLVGPAEGWTINDAGVTVGKSSGRTILLLEDLLTLFESQGVSVPEVITCSIDPTPEAIERLGRLERTLDAEANVRANREAMGMMSVRFTGIPAESRMAQILAAADYRMKTLSLGFEDSPIKQFPSYTSMIKRPDGRYGQRFWIAPEYKTIYHDTDRLVWNLSASTVKTLTEREYFGANGEREKSEKKDVQALRWAENMTERYTELSEAIPVFAEAKNCMDIALAVALILREGLPQKAGCPVEKLVSAVKRPTGAAPQKVPADSLCRPLGRGLISVTGGVSINPWAALETNVALNAELDRFIAEHTFIGENWWAD